MKNKTCVICNISFEFPKGYSYAQWEKRKVCSSKKCLSIFRYGVAPLCIVCGKEFRKNGDSNMKCCSWKCRNIQMTIKTPARICEICGIEFHRKKGYPTEQYNSQITCSISCRTVLLKQMDVGFQKGHPVYSEEGRFEKGQAANNKGIPMSNAQKNKISEILRNSPNVKRGSDNSNWKGGVSPLRDSLRHSRWYKDWRYAVYKRDNWTCQNCGKIGSKLAAHHVKAFSLIMDECEIKSMEQAKLCSELWDVSNGVTLCMDCHRKTDNYLSGARKKLLVTRTTDRGKP